MRCSYINSNFDLNITAMDATISLTEKEFTHELLDKLKLTFSGKKFRIEVEEEMDETEYLFGNPVMKEILETRLQRIERKEGLIEVKPEDLV